MVKLPQFPVEGGCICGAVRYRIGAPPLGIYDCHCKDCLRQSGGDYSASMIVRRDDFALIAGEPLAFDKTADSGRIVRYFACPVCHTRTHNEPLSAAEIFVVKPGTLDDRSWALPVGAIWTASKTPWSIIEADEPNYPGQAPSREPLYAAWRERMGLA